ncbi:bacterial alpha-L-rhamnosidase-domain-containing protein [Aspergillus alliaceus]|uniref:bacterial alpha-L-rhamnosidase-domain-containing protein n=1 Tax=Petromyces alliaceus TaxID=209559 RepID=UPI0012A60616|nr:bacterial alpha-L-rhamnosidase-domain-containing protein [Aspergillus alliaceus]KAB8233339.1 bacterial alpha-L-rhamnosidase-domain-containing protein [Aspergillus alliaceus]
MALEIRYICGPLHDTITWGCAVCFLPELIKRYYGSTHVYSRVYQPCVRYMEYMKTKERKGGLIEHGLGDWGYDIAFGNHQANIETTIYYHCLRNVVIMAKELGFTEDAILYEAWAARIYDVYNSHLLVSDKTEYPYAFYTSLDNPGTHDRTMVNQAIAPQFGLMPVGGAYRTWTLRPPLLSELNFVEGEVGCPYGLIRACFDLRQTEEGTEVRVPTSTVCTLQLPSNRSLTAIHSSGSQEVKKMNGPEVILMPVVYNYVIWP